MRSSSPRIWDRRSMPAPAQLRTALLVSCAGFLLACPQTSTTPKAPPATEAAQAAPALIELSANGAELATRFAQNDKGARLLMILSPT